MKGILFMSLLGLIFTLGACKSNNIDSNTSEPTITENLDKPSKPELVPLEEGRIYAVGDKCPTINIRYTNGALFNTMQYYGKVIILNFWFYSCGPCVSEIPMLDYVAKEYKGRVVTAAIHEGEIYDGYSSYVKGFIENNFKDLNIKFLYSDPKNTLFNALGGSNFFPYTVILDRLGTISYIHKGRIYDYELHEALDKIL